MIHYSYFFFGQSLRVRPQDVVVYNLEDENLVPDIVLPYKKKKGNGFIREETY